MTVSPVKFVDPHFLFEKSEQGWLSLGQRIGLNFPIEHTHIPINH